MPGGPRHLILPLSLGARAAGTLLAVALLYMLNLHSDGPVSSPVPRPYFWEVYTLASGLLAWFLSYLWTYALSLEGYRLSVPTWVFGARELDLRELVRVEEAGALKLRLHFKGGTSAAVLKFVRGRDALLRRLEAHAARAAP